MAENDVCQFRERVEPCDFPQFVVAEIDAFEVGGESGEHRGVSQLGDLVVAERELLQPRPSPGVRLVGEAFGEDAVERNVAAMRDTQRLDLASEFGDAA